MIPQWIYRNLEEFGNCLIPHELVNEKGVEALETEISKKTKKHIVIKCSKTSHLYLDDVYRYENYIAEVKEHE